MNATELQLLLHERADAEPFEPVDAGSIIAGAQRRRRREQLRASGVLGGLVAAGVIAVLVMGAPKSERPASLIPATSRPQPTTSVHATPTQPTPSLAALPANWIAATAGPLPAQDSIGTPVGTKIIYWGGGDGVDTETGYSSKGALFDVTRRRWFAMASSPLSGRTSMATAGSDALFFVWSGYGPGQQYFDDGAIFDPAANSWKRLAPAPFGGQPTLGAVWSGTEFVVVTQAGRHSPNHAAAYNPTTNSWRQLPDLPTSPASANLMLVSGRIVVFGANVSYALSPGAGAWTGVASPANIEAATLAMATDGNYVYAVGSAAVLNAPVPAPLSFQRFTFAAGGWDVRPAPPVSAVGCYPSLSMSTTEVFLSYCSGNAMFNRAGQFWTSASDAGIGQPIAMGAEFVFYSPGAARTVIYTGP